MAALAAFARHARVPRPADKVHKDECALSWETADSEDGIYVCMTSFLCFGRPRVGWYFERTGYPLYLQILRRKIPIERAKDEAPKPKPTKLAIGVEGGFDVDAELFEIQYTYNVVTLPDFASYPLRGNSDIPPEIAASAEAIIAVRSVRQKEETASWEEERLPSRFADALAQLDTGVKIKPSGWKCERCDVTDNLWLNLTDGMVLCGRRYHDGTGGNNHAVEHFEETGFPLCVKLGTITPHGADVYSYAEDNMVLDPKLREHLAHWGINIAEMTKTVATMAELEIELNLRARQEADRILEHGVALVPALGPALCGLVNLGNSCYMNSVLQVLFHTREFRYDFYNMSQRLFGAAPADPTGDLNTQLAKLAVGMLSGAFSRPASDVALCADQEGLAPHMLKSIVGRNHREFSSTRQQDALDYFAHILDAVERAAKAANIRDASRAFKYEVEDRLEDVDSGTVRYTAQTSKYVPLAVRPELITNAAAVAEYEALVQAEDAAAKRDGRKPADLGEPVRPHIRFHDCLARAMAEEAVPDFISPVTGRRTVAKRSWRFKTFPDQLVFGVSKYYMDDTWQAKKWDISLDVPLTLDLSGYRATGPLPHERIMPAEAAAQPAAPKAPPIDEGAVAQLVEMGIHPNGARRAVAANTGNVEAAVMWAFEHQGDADFELPYVPPGAEPAGPAVDEGALTMLCDMGYPRSHAIKALKATSNNLERAFDWIMSHPDEPEAPSGGAAAAAGGAAAGLPDGPGTYHLFAMISHMGKSTDSGHYVAHVRVGDKWILFNDAKVVESVQPAFDLGYIYIYQRDGAEMPIDGRLPWAEDMTRDPAPN